jgi:mannose-6-phosphate isomerase-like protein (cupin superfamily)
VVPVPKLDPDAPDAPLSLLRLESIAADLARGAHRWQSIVRHEPDRRWYERILRTDDYEAWVLGWDLAQGIELHDHGGSSGALCVIEGLLLETYTDSWTRRPQRTRRIGAGDAFAFPADHVHHLVNPGPGIATSVHVYSPPLVEMTFYDDRAESHLEPLRTERTEERRLTLA